MAANIFPGDMLYKNFGVTRHGRVVFYDYDEIEYITDCNFRDIPQPRNEEDEMSAEPWYSIGKHDVFPEQFGAFLLGNAKIRKYFMAHHADLLTRDFWQARKQRIMDGHIEDVYPVPAADPLLQPDQLALTTPADACAAGFHAHLIWRTYTMNDPVVIVGAARTPMGAFQGDFSSKSANDLGAVAIAAAVERSGVDKNLVEHVYFGNCLMAGQGQAPARQAAIKAGLPLSAGAVTLSKMCGSAMQTTIFAHDTLLAGSADVIVAGGMESMTNAPYLIPKARGGYRIGHGMMYDHMMLDGLEDAYSKDEKTGGGRSMGTFAEECATKYAFTREAQDAFAIESVKRAQAATNEGHFKWEIAPVTVSGRAGDTVIDKDEGPLKAKLDKIPSLRPAFKKDGTITAASSSSINDGAAALVLMRESTAKKLGLTADRPHRRPRHPRAGTEPVHHRPDRRAAKAARRRPAGARPTSTCSRSTKRSPRCRWPRCTNSISRTARSTSTAAPARWATRSAHPARASSSPCSAP